MPDRGTDWYQVDTIDEATFAIREPRYWQKNINYLLLGDERALLFDTGSGRGDIAGLAAQRTTLPIVALCSHAHYDHIGNHHQFASVAMPDLPEHRACTHAGRYRSRWRGTLAVRPRRFDITEWWQPGTSIDLGSRVIEIFHAPGHSSDSIVLLDRERRQLFVGDFIYPYDLFMFLPGSGLADYRRTTDRLLRLMGCADVMLPGHEGFMEPSALTTLAEALAAIADGSASFTRKRMLGFPVRRYAFDGLPPVLVGRRALGRSLTPLVDAGESVTPGEASP